MVNKMKMDIDLSDDFDWVKGDGVAYDFENCELLNADNGIFTLEVDKDAFNYSFNITYTYEDEDYDFKVFFDRDGSVSLFSLDLSFGEAGWEDFEDLYDDEDDISFDSNIRG